MSRLHVEASGPLRGELRVPGDKSVSHRSLLFNTLARGTARIRGLLGSDDVMSTLKACAAMGARIEEDSAGVVLRSEGRLVEPADVIDCGNSGTTIRLLTGAVASEPIFAVLTGDVSLRGRPMGRVTRPLLSMGARIDGRDGGQRAPLAIRGGDLRIVNQDLPIASAQVKTAMLLAGRREGIRVREPAQSRDHTERMLRHMGANLTLNAAGWLVLEPIDVLEPLDVHVPGDLSSAAFMLVAGAIVPGSEVLVRGVGINPTRAGVIDALVKMHARIDVNPIESPGAEPVADVLVEHGGLRGTVIDGELALRCLDELPVLAVAAAFAEGETVIADAAELRVKESDRIRRVVDGLRAMGVEVEERPDGMVIQGGRPHGPARVDASGDHRIAMAFAVAALASSGGVQIDGAESISSSYPTFLTQIEALRV